MATSAADYRVAKAEQSVRAKWATLCYYYPQYRLEDFDDDSLTTGDIDLLINTAELKETERLRDQLFVATGARSKKGFKAVLSNLKKRIKELEKHL